MSDNRKRKLFSPEEVQRQLDGLVGSGAIVLGHGKRLKVGNDGFLQVTSPTQDSNLTPHLDSQKRLVNIINYLESSASLKSVGWCEALVSLRQLRDIKSECDEDLDIRAWNVCKTANSKATADFKYMYALDALLRDDNSEDKWPGDEYEYQLDQFPQRACRLLGVRSSEDYSQKAWDDGLAERMLEKDLEMYRLIDRCFYHIMKAYKRPYHSHISEDPSALKAVDYLELFRKLEEIQALLGVMETKHFLILQRKAKTARRLQQARQPATKRGQPRE
ncbi:hypothetical protein NCS52_00711800 [Fusarium sp. LHS14.1]|nr:hypothetical protein NCS52_00711800 [Fusarium sp. LHS14.1]